MAIKEKTSKKLGRSKTAKKIKTEKSAAAETAIESPAKAKKYIYAVGRRKTAKARVKFFEEGSGKIAINGRALSIFFPSSFLQETVSAPLKVAGQENHDIECSVAGGGKTGQAEAVRLGIARALVKWNADFKPALKAVGFMTRDPRAKERKKFGLKKARRAPQWAKR
ncbi:MAG: 30S ribosomal protein S9 [Candidatus Magasanikbacteria bacterium]|nr:30S ribosomal protein S9 [Candidatus Magasanikbacteria bacterium]